MCHPATFMTVSHESECDYSSQRAQLNNCVNLFEKIKVSECVRIIIICVRFTIYVYTSKVYQMCESK